MSRPRKLTEKQRRFVEAYMGEAAGNATQAARLAGYKGNDRTLGTIAGENMKKPVVIEAIAERRESCPLIATREERQQFYTDMMNGKIESESIDRQGNVVMVKPTNAERLRAAELLGKTQGDFIDRVQHDVGPNVGAVVEEMNAIFRRRREREGLSLPGDPYALGDGEDTGGDE